MSRNCSADYTQVTMYFDSVLLNGMEVEENELKVALYAAAEPKPGEKKPSSVNRTKAESRSTVARFPDRPPGLAQCEDTK